MDQQLLSKIAWIGDAFVEGPVRGIVLRTSALGVVEWKDAPDDMELEWAGQGALVVKTYHDPWAWMNRRTREFLDDFIITLRGAFKLGENIPLIAAGGSMGGHGALMYSVHAQKRITACLAICPPCDLVYQYSARPSTPRTMHHAFDNYGDISRQLVEHSPLHQVHKLPDIPYLIVHGAKDVDVSVTHHSDALVAAMKARGLRVEYHRPPLMTHSGGCDFVSHRRIIDFVGEHFALNGVATGRLRVFDIGDPCKQIPPAWIGFDLEGPVQPSPPDIWLDRRDAPIIASMDPALELISCKVHAGERLSAADGLTLLRSNDIWTIGELADQVRRRLHGNAVYYNINRHVNYTNLCALSCKFCSFYRKAGEDGEYEYSVEQIAQQAREAQAAGATEIHIVGGLHPYLPLSYYTDMLQAIRQAAPRLHIKAFTAVEIVHLTRIAHRPGAIAGVLRELQEAGLGSLPGGGAEVFDDRVHDQAFKGKIRSDQWLEVHRQAHQLGLHTNATILYGHIELLEDRVHHLCLLREAQDEAIAGDWPGRFQTVIPLPFIPDDSELERLPGPTGLQSLKMLAVCRLMLDNFAHVKAFWVMHTLELAQVSLSFGVDDIDGTVVWYDITKLDGAGTHQEVGVADLRRAAREAGYEPIERDTLYRRVTRHGADWHVDEESHKSQVGSRKSAPAAAIPS